MLRDDTSIGGPARGFPSTSWSAVLAAGSPSDAEPLDRLLRAYWKPVFGFIRASGRRTIEDAKDLTQAFFAEALRRDLIARVRPERGSFRAYLKQALRNFTIDAARAEAARRPETPLISLEAAPAELERLGPAAPDEPPERVFDREWFNAVMDACVTELRERCAAEDRRAYFDVFWAYCLQPSSAGLTYKDIATQCGLTATDVGHYIAWCRDVMRDLLRARVRDYVECDADVEAELAEVVRG